MKCCNCVWPDCHLSRFATTCTIVHSAVHTQIDSDAITELISFYTIRMHAKNSHIPPGISKGARGKRLVTVKLSNKILINYRIYPSLFWSLTPVLFENTQRVIHPRFKLARSLWCARAQISADHRLIFHSPGILNLNPLLAQMAHRRLLPSDSPQLDKLKLLNSMCAAITLSVRAVMSK